jgi:hypothetical protein
MLVGNPEEKIHSGELGIEERIILKWIVTKQRRGVDWIHLAQDVVCWRAVVYAETNLHIPQKASNFFIS